MKLTQPLVKLFVHWLYTKTVPDVDSFEEWSPIIDSALEPSMYDAWMQKVFLVLIKAYAFGNKFLATRFRQDVNQAFSDHLHCNRLELPDGWHVMEYAFKHVPLDRPILQHLADHHCNFWPESYDKEIDIQAQKRLPRSFLMRVNRRFSELLPTINTAWKGSPPRCYYEHASEKEMQKCGKSHMVYDEDREYGYFPKER
ncbi:hypothetical protein HBI56_168850 [Parastagonospora nodorum]|nr:hypothetical protein HBH53_184280 [Parastagonospora nodorum]KAH3997640.1 hypothetical protein HBI10_143490 [Parastagonospora nodorum]KAH4021118.1 hypothetical protein HBI13_111790 [Parastagonospora nodorum]KAH4037098.1 hypothetical protein HBI09_065880 [Parastagonospora nodorum]KAH4057776.1 hypothetical protein HBH50_234880 [Parastagonospora nodorum]